MMIAVSDAAHETTKIISASRHRREAKLRALRDLDDSEKALDAGGYLEHMILAVPALAAHRDCLRATSPTSLYWCPRGPGTFVSNEILEAAASSYAARSLRSRQMYQRKRQYAVGASASQGEADFVPADEAPGSVADSLEAGAGQVLEDLLSSQTAGRDSPVFSQDRGLAPCGDGSEQERKCVRQNFRNATGMLTNEDTPPLPATYDNSYSPCNEAGFCVHKGPNIRLALLRKNIGFVLRAFIGKKEIDEMTVALRFQGKTSREDAGAIAVLYYVPAKAAWAPFAMSLVPMRRVEVPVADLSSREMRLKVAWEFHHRDAIVPVCDLWTVMVRMLNMEGTPFWELNKMNIISNDDPIPPEEWRPEEIHVEIPVGPGVIVWASGGSARPPGRFRPDDGEGDKRRKGGRPRGAAAAPKRESRAKREGRGPRGLNRTILLTRSGLQVGPTDGAESPADEAKAEAASAPRRKTEGAVAGKKTGRKRKQTAEEGKEVADANDSGLAEAAAVSQQPSRRKRRNAGPVVTEASVEEEGLRGATYEDAMMEAIAEEEVKLPCADYLCSVVLLHCF